MTIAELAVLLPCHSLEDFPQYHEGDDAASLLSAWTALWHPALVATCGKPPRWYRADFPPDETTGRVFTLPAPSERLIATGWPARMEDSGAVIVTTTGDRPRDVAELLAKCELGASPDDDLVADFFALGYCYLQVELLTRQMRYASNIDEPHFETQVVAAANAAASGDAGAARDALRKCFEVLHEARDRFYPVEAYVIDLVLTAPAFIGERLRGALATSPAASVLVTGELLERIAEQEPETLSALREAVAAGKACVVGGDRAERELPLESLPMVIENLQSGRAAYERHLGRPATVYARRRFGLSPLLPALLHRSGFIGSVHCTFDDGIVPFIGHSKTRWQGLDGGVIDAFGRVPLDARTPEAFLSFNQKLAETMDLDHVATAMLVHWPGDTSPWFADLLRAHAYGPILGRFVTLEHFFSETDTPGRMTKFEADDYRGPYLKQAVARGEADPISRRVDRLRADAAGRATGALVAFRELATGAAPQALAPRSLVEASRELIDALAGSARAAGGIAAANPLAHVASVSDDDNRHPLLQAPGFGFAWTSAPAPALPSGKKAQPPIAVERRLQNELLEVVVDEHTGGIRAFRDLKSRGNRLSQQIALRLPGPKSEPGQTWRDPDDAAIYSVMAADEIVVERSTTEVGQITSRGRLLDREGKLQGRYEQRLRLLRASPVLNVEINVEPLVELPKDPWQAYYACRFAWPDDTAELRRSVHGTSQPTRLKRIEAPHFVEIHEDRARTAILTGGLPFHRRSGERMLDAMLIVAGETRREFRLALGVNLGDLASAAEETLLGGLPVVPLELPAEDRSGWLFHLDASNVVALDWQPVSLPPGSSGFRVRLLETLGKAGRVKLRTLKPVAGARQIDERGESIVTVPTADDSLLIDFAAFELVRVEAWF